MKPIKTDQTKTITQFIGKFNFSLFIKNILKQNVTFYVLVLIFVL